MERLLSQSLLFQLLVLIFSSWVQLSDSTSARGRSEELLLQLFVSRETYADVATCSEGNSLVLVFVFLNCLFRFL